MSNGEIQLMIAAFQDENAAEAALGALKEAKKEKLIDIKDAAVLRKDTSGKLHVKEVGDMGGTKGAVIGGVVGAALGVLSGGVTIALTGVGALAGGLAAKLRDSGFNDDRLKKLGEGLKPGSSAIVAVTGDKQLAQEVIDELRKAGAADVLTESISADVASQLDAGRDVIYGATAGPEGATAGRAFTDGKVSGAEGVVVTEGGVAAVRVVADEDETLAQGVAATEESIVAMESYEKKAGDQPQT